MNKYSPKQFNPKHHYKRYGLSDYLQAERRHVTRMAWVCFGLLLVVGFAWVAYMDAQTVSDAIQLGAYAR